MSCSLILGASINRTLLILILPLHLNEVLLFKSSTFTCYLNKHYRRCLLPVFRTAWKLFWQGGKKKVSWQKSKSVKETPLRTFYFEKKVKIKNCDFFWNKNIDLFEVSFWESSDWSKDYWRFFFFLPLLLLDLNSVPHFNFSICSPCSCSEALPCSDMPLCLIISFLLNFYKKQPLFYSSSEWNPFFVFMIKFFSELLCSVFISCRLGQYHLCFKSWTTSVFFQSPPAFRSQSLKLKNVLRTCEKKTPKDWLDSALSKTGARGSNYNKDHEITQV